MPGDPAAARAAAAAAQTVHGGGWLLLSTGSLLSSYRFSSSILDSTRTLRTGSGLMPEAGSRGALVAGALALAVYFISTRRSKRCQQEQQASRVRAASEAAHASDKDQSAPARLRIAVEGDERKPVPSPPPAARRQLDHASPNQRRRQLYTTTGSPGGSRSSSRLGSTGDASPVERSDANCPFVSFQPPPERQEAPSRIVRSRAVPHAQRLGATSLAAPGSDAVLPQPEVASEMAEGQAQWDDSYFAGLLEEDEDPSASAIKANSPPDLPGDWGVGCGREESFRQDLLGTRRETLSTSFFATHGGLGKSSSSPSRYPFGLEGVNAAASIGRASMRSVTNKIAAGALGVRIKDVKREGSSDACVQVLEIMSGGLVWRQGDIEPGDILVRLNSEAILGCDHLNDLVAQAASAGEGIELSYQRSVWPFAFFAAVPATNTVTLCSGRGRKAAMANSETSGAYSSGSNAASPVSAGAPESPINGARVEWGVSLFPAEEATETIAAASPDQQGRDSESARSSAVQSSVMVFNDQDMQGVLGESEEKQFLTDVLGHHLSETGQQNAATSLDAASLLKGYVLADGSAIDLEKRRPAHWYARRSGGGGERWEPYSDKASDLIESAFLEGYDTLDFGDSHVLLLPERFEVRLGSHRYSRGHSDTRRALLRGTWHYQTSAGTFAPYAEETAAQIDTILQAPKALLASPMTIGQGRQIQRLASGLLVQRCDGSRPVRLVLHGRPATIGRPNVDTETEATTALNAGDVVSKLVHTLSHTTLSSPFELPPGESMPQQNKTKTGVHWLAR